MLNFKAKNYRDNLVIFVHGFTGGEETWVRKDKKRSVMEYLLLDSNFLTEFDVAIFNYFTKITDVFSSKKGWFSQLLSVLKLNWKNQRNLDIRDLSDLLGSHIETKCSNYKRIILVAHSMGGLVSKAYIVQSERQRVHLYISLAVPHNGSNTATLAKMIIGNPQVKDLAPLGTALDDMTRSWIKPGQKLPKTVYVEGKNDDVVRKTSSLGFESRSSDYFKIVHSDHDHFSIVTPDNSEDIVVLAIKQECWLAIQPKSEDATDGRSDLPGDSDSLPTTQQAVQAEFFRKQQIKSINAKLNHTISRDFDGINFFTRNFKDRNDRVLTFDEMRSEIISSDFVVISGIGGIGKSLTIKRLIADLSTNFLEPFFIYCDAKNWDARYSSGLENMDPPSKPFTSLLDCFGANVTYGDIERLQLSKYDDHVLKIIFIDGLNEIPSEETRKKILSLLKLVHRQFGFKIVIGTRHFNHNEYRTYNSFKIEKVDRTELETVLRQRFHKGLSNYSERNLEYLSLPFFLDIALKSGKDRVGDYSGYIYAHVLKGIEKKLHNKYLDELSTLAYEAYQSEQKFVIQRVNPAMEKEYLKSKILMQDGSGYKFEHHLVNEFLVAFKISQSSSLWNDQQFDLITFEDKKSFEIIQMILEQISDIKTGEQYLRSVYNWNFYAALHCLKYVENKYSIEFARVITLILSEKLFDRYSHTRNGIVNTLQELFNKFEIKGIEADQIHQILNLNAASRMANFKNIISANEQYFLGNVYENWYTIFSASTGEPTPENIAKIVDNDPLIGWTCSNVLKRSSFDDKVALQLMVLFEASKDSTEKWRIVHALGNGNSESIIPFLLKTLKLNEFIWVSYGALRSILEIAIFIQSPEECEKTLNALFDILERVTFYKDVIRELRACLIEQVLSEKIKPIISFYDKVIASDHKNFEARDLLELSKQEFLRINEN